MAAPSVFLSSVTAAYPAAREVYQFLRDRDISCFFCDEAMLRAGGTSYRQSMERALKAAGHLVILLGAAGHARNPSVLDALREFSRPEKERRIVTLLCQGIDPGTLPAEWRNHRILLHPGQLEALHHQLIFPHSSVEAPACPVPQGEPASDRKPLRSLWALTAANSLILGLMLWSLYRYGIIGQLPALAGRTERSALPPTPRTAAPASNSGTAAAGQRNQTPNDAVEASLLAASGKAAPPAAAPATALETTRFLTESETVRAAADPTPGTLAQIRIAKLWQDFSWIPPGTFLMGSPAGETNRRSDEIQRPVNITQGFWLARTECTQQLWTSVTGSPSPSAIRGATLPADGISWQEVSAGNDSFLARINSWQILPPGWRFVIPEETQWEYACRAGTTSPFSFGDTLDGTLANCDGRLAYGTPDTNIFANRARPVGSYPPNAWGLHDMHGNLAEWCLDRDGPLNLNPAATDPFSELVERGGSWRFNAGLCRSASRSTINGGTGADTLGFRLAIVAVN
jgi:formylglycine-generating enzyme